MALMDDAELRARTKRTSHRPNEVRAHIHAALNVGATRQEVAEVIFQMVTYGGMPVVVERGEPFPAEEPSR
jgi:alkylhydroperoxidase/carboxymuconolactone decarboxylase family protein YurZ